MNLTNVKNDKKMFLEALKKNNGKLDEMTVGETLGFKDAHINFLIGLLLEENKIQFQSIGLCSYSIV